MKHTPLEVNDVIQISISAVRRAERLFPDQRMKILGHKLQFTHDAEYTAAGWSMVLQTNSYDLYDRSEPSNQFLYDDKICTFYDQDGKIKSLSRSHSISGDEKIRWDRHLKEGGESADVIIMSFDYTDELHDFAIFKGALSWRRMRDYIKPMRSSYAIDITSSRKYNTV